MKNVIKIMSVIFLTSLTFVSCNKVKSLADVTFDTAFTADLECIVPPSSERDINGLFSATAVIDPTSDPNIAEYLEKIKGYTILSMKGTILSITKEDVNLISSTVSVSNSAGNASWQFSNVPLTVGGVLDLSNDNGQWNTVNQILMTGQQFTVSMAGETDKDDVTFTVQLSIKVEVTANPL